jgi:hypothetical protein
LLRRGKIVERNPQSYSLAAVQKGEGVELCRILFDEVREFCRDLGLREGSVVTCRNQSNGPLVLQREDGVTVLFDRDRARFISVRARSTR